MCEIFLLIFLSRKIASMARDRNRNATGYVVLFVSVWIVGEILGAILGATISHGDNELLIYGGALAGAAVAATAAFLLISELSVLEASPGGIANFAAMLNNMGEAGGEKLAELFNKLNSRGAANYAALLREMTAAEAESFASWLEAATAEQIHAVATFFNERRPSEIRGMWEFCRDQVPPRATPARRQLRKAAPPILDALPATPSYADLKQAVIGGNVSEVLRLLGEGFDVNTRNEHGETLLLNAVCMGDARLNMARALVSRGADVNARIHGRTLLHFLDNPTYCDNAHTLAFLRRHGAQGIVAARPALAPTADGLIHFACSGCGKRLKVKPRGVGRPLDCPRCRQQLQVPQA